MTAMTTSLIAVTARVVLIIAAAAIVIGSYAPWLNHESEIGLLAFHGVDGHGVFTALCGVVIAVLGVIRSYLGSVIIAALVSAVALVTCLAAQDRIDSFGADYFGGSIGWGLHGVIGGGMAASAAAAICYRHGRTHGAAPTLIQN